MPKIFNSPTRRLQGKLRFTESGGDFLKRLSRSIRTVGGPFVSRDEFSMSLNTTGYAGIE